MNIVSESERKSLSALCVRLVIFTSVSFLVRSLHAYVSLRCMCVCILCEYNHARVLSRVPELCETLGPDVLTGMLDAGQQVGDELVDGTFVLDGSRDALSDLDLVALTARMEQEEAALGLVIPQRGQC